MKTKFFITLLLGFYAFLAYSQTPSAKEVQTDKSGRFIYALARDADPEVAFSVAYTDLVNKLQPKIEEYNIDLLKKSIQRIDNEAFKIHRVILFVDFENLNNNGVAMVEEPGEILPTEPKVTNVEVAEVVNVTEKMVETSDSIKAEIVNVEIIDDFSPEGYIEDPKVEMEEISETEDTFQSPNNEGSIEAEPSLSVTIPEGRLGDTIRYILSQESIKGVQNQLEKARSSMVISQYGSGPSKYIDHAFVVTLDGKNIKVYSPKDKNGNRTNYATGESSANTKGTRIYWFLKR